MLKTLKLENFTVFPKAELEFSPGLNVIVGENGTGKSHLLKLGYAVLRAIYSFERDKIKSFFEFALHEVLREIFKVNTISFLVRHSPVFTEFNLSASWGEAGLMEIRCGNINEGNSQLSKSSMLELPKIKYENLIQRPVVIPPKEILSIYYGFQAALGNREFDFDATYLELTKALAPTPLKGNALEKVKDYVAMVEKIIGGAFYSDGSRFYFKKGDTPDIAASMTAEGHRKIGMLAYLIKNGSLAPGSSLFWDEPEANLNPKLQAKLAEILVELSNVMQITIATHSLFLLREIEILQEQKKIDVPPKFFGLHFGEDGGVEVTEGKSLSFIGDTVALNMEIDQSTRYLNL